MYCVYPWARTRHGIHTTVKENLEDEFSIMWIPGGCWAWQQALLAGLILLGPYSFFMYMHVTMCMYLSTWVHVCSCVYVNAPAHVCTHVCRSQRCLLQLILGGRQPLHGPGAHRYGKATWPGSFRNLPVSACTAVQGLQTCAGLWS